MIEQRQYQLFLISEILRARDEGKSLIIELDAGLGKRILSYLLLKHLGKNERLLIITPSQASVRDTYTTFLKLYKEEKGNPEEIGYIAAGIPSRLKENILREKRVVISTPISLANILRRKPDLINSFKIIIVNEVDKVVRRIAEEVPEGEDEESVFLTADKISNSSIKRRLRVVYPWSELIKHFPDDAIIIGMSGTLRDKHLLRTEGKILFKPELETLLDTLFKGREVDIITMDKIIRGTDISKFLLKNITIIRPIGVFDDKVKKILDALTEEMNEVAKRLAKRYEKMLEDSFTTTVEKAIGLIPDTDFLKRKFLRLALIRKFVSASIPEHYSKFLKKRGIKRIIESRTGEKIDELLPKESTKIQKILEIAERWLEANRKVTILTSYVRVATRILEKFKERGYKTFLLTGKTFDKGGVLSEFKEYKEPAVLVMTPVGERDIDLAQIDLIIVHDVISTVKTMYQRFKRGRRSRVLILYYEDTFEKEKVMTLLDKMKRKYPWTIKIEK